jgi:hypothetical protein
MNMGPDWIRFQYFEFSDVPRCFILSHHNKWFLFESRFLKELDDYSDEYVVWELDPTSLSTPTSFGDASNYRRMRWSSIPINRIVFCREREGCGGYFFGWMKAEGLDSLIPVK